MCHFSKLKAHNYVCIEGFYMQHHLKLNSFQFLRTFSIICFHFVYHLLFSFSNARVSESLLKDNFAKYLLVNQQYTCKNNKNNLVTDLFPLNRMIY